MIDIIPSELLRAARFSGSCSADTRIAMALRTDERNGLFSGGQAQAFTFTGRERERQLCEAVPFISLPPSRPGSRSPDGSRNGASPLARTGRAECGRHDRRRDDRPPSTSTPRPSSAHSPRPRRRGDRGRVRARHVLAHVREGDDDRAAEKDAAARQPLRCPRLASRGPAEVGRQLPQGMQVCPPIDAALPIDAEMLAFASKAPRHAAGAERIGGTRSGGRNLRGHVVDARVLTHDPRRTRYLT